MFLIAWDAASRGGGFLGGRTKRHFVRRRNRTKWTYHATKKHAVIAAGSHAYGYDLNGNQVTRDGNDVTWTSDNYPSRIENGSKAHDFYYDGQRNRWKQVYTNGSSSETTIHVGGLLEKRTEGSYSEYRHYIQVGGRAVALYTRPTSGPITTRYLLHDHQGSVAEITDSAGGGYVGESFGAFGERRDPADWSGPVGAADEAAIAAATQRGYTLHGHLESGGLIHMNGRVADSLTGRFLSADPYVPYPGLSQSFNRYAYVHNNPLTFSDPSGFTLGPGPLWRLDSGGFEFGGFGGLDIDGGISLSFLWGGRSHSGQSRPAPVKGCFVPGTSGCYGKAPVSGMFDVIFDTLGGPMPGYGSDETLVLYFQDPANALPDDDASDQEVVDWVVEHRAEFGIEIAVGVKVIAVPEHKVILLSRIVTVKEPGHEPVSGSFDGDTIKIYKDGLTAGIKSRIVTHPAETADGVGTIDFVGVHLSRIESVVQTLGHEAAHSMRIDAEPKDGQLHHPNADQKGWEALDKFRMIYGDSE